MTSTQRAQLLEERLISFAVRITELANSLQSTFAALHYAKQIVRSGSAPALLYGEARSAESAQAGTLDELLGRNNQLISIFVASVRTTVAKINQRKDAGDSADNR